MAGGYDNLGHDEIVDSKRRKAILTNFRQPEKNCLEMGKTWRIAAIPTLCALYIVWQDFHFQAA
ncbi:hypothetical protein [Simonsiella muelleri]|uniref:hypothetical protein n=1 Tax=Simonsiella muelleri TaxID=72 RepID=UPI0023F042BB|nr:hypothetical protein [Simonsiella muelleri]